MALITDGLAQLNREQHPLPGPLRYGLFTVANPRQIFPSNRDPNLSDHAFGNGLFYDPYGCGEAHGYDITCETPAEKTFDPNSAERPVLPFVVYATLVCGAPPGYPIQYLSDKTGERLFSSEQEAVEAAFWTGSNGQSPAIDAAAGAVDVGAAGTFPNIVSAVAALEAHAYGPGAHYGYHATLHANTAVAAYAQADHLVYCASEKGYVWGAEPTDPVLRTAIGTKWIFGGGYPGTGPDGLAPDPGETFIWITGLVSTWRPNQWSPPNPMQVMDREINELRFIAERNWLATYDCFHAYARVAIPEVAA